MEIKELEILNDRGLILRIKPMIEKLKEIIREEKFTRERISEEVKTFSQKG